MEIINVSLKKEIENLSYPIGRSYNEGRCAAHQGPEQAAERPGGAGGARCS